MNRIRLILCCVALIAFAQDLIAEKIESHANSGSLKQSIDQLLDPTALDATALLFVDLESGKTIYKLNDHLPLKPASVMKLATSDAALRKLGPDFTWKTKVSIIGLQNGRARIVALTGSGDPSLTNEALWQLARQLYKSGVRQIDTLLLDDTAFVDRRLRTGGRAFEGGSSALAFNYNSLGFSACPTSIGQAARIATDPWEMEAELKGKVLTTARQGEPVLVDDQSSCEEKNCKLSFKLGGTVAHDSVCIDLFRSVERPTEYLGRVFVRFLKGLGIGGAMQLSYGKAPEKIDLFFNHTSSPLRQVLIGLNNFSTNVTADQLVYAIGIQETGTNSFEQGIAYINSEVRKIAHNPGDIVILDGSGLSHDNRLTAHVIINILRQQYENIQYGLEYQSSLSVWGRSGTLQKRTPLPEGVLIRGKTGSLDGVSTIAGYLYRADKSAIAFAILQNRVASKAKAVDIEDKILEVVARSH